MSKLSKVSLLFAGLSLLSLSLIRYLLGEWVPFCWVALALTFFFVGFAAFWDRVLLKQFLAMKTTKQGLSMGALILVVLVGLVATNILGLRYYKTFDFSLSKLNTLAPQSVQVLGSLREEIKVLFFYKKGVEGNEENRRLFKELVKRYQDRSSLVRLDFVEVNERPDLAKEYGVDKGSGVVFVDYQGRKNRIEKIDEQELTNAMLKVVNSKGKKAYFTIGHGELDLNEMQEATGAHALKLLLENNQFQVQELSLIANAMVPEDADLLVVLGPKQGFQAFEVQSVRDYLKRGGGLVLALESQNTVGLESLLEDLGVSLANNYVINVVETMMGRGLNQGPTMGSVFSIESPVSRIFKKGEITLFRYPTALEVKTIPALKQEVLVATDKNAAAFADLTLKNEVGSGPFSLAVEVKGKFGGEKESVVMVVGDADFLTNQMLYQNLNRDLALNMMAAAARDEAAISVTPKEAEVTRMNFTETKFALFLFGFIIPLPILFLGIATTLWYRRRNA